MRSILGSLITIAACSAGQSIPIEQLTHRVPTSAAREYRASTKALENGRIEESIVHCRKAIEADPDNAWAHNDLGVLYLSDDQTEKARAEFEKAVALHPKFVMAYINESFVLLALNRPVDAESAARKALEIVPEDRRANLLLGWSLTAQSHFSKEASRVLHLAAREYPEAHLAAADVLIHDGSIDGARKEVQAYLASGSTDHKSLAEDWLRLLKIE